MTGNRRRTFLTGTNFNLKFYLLPVFMWSNAAGPDFATFRAYLHAWGGADMFLESRRLQTVLYMDQLRFRMLFDKQHCPFQWDDLQELQLTAYAPMLLKNSKLNYEQVHLFEFFSKQNQAYLFIYNFMIFFLYFSYIHSYYLLPFLFKIKKYFLDHI